MTHQLKKIIGIVLLLSSSLAASSRNEQRNVTSKDEGNVVCITIPKAGSHLLIKCLSLLNINGLALDYNEWQEKRTEKIDLKAPLPQYFIERIEKGKKTSQRLYWYGHQHHTPEFEQYLENNSYANFFLVRDPRDQLMSVALWKKNEKKFKNMSTQAALLSLIVGEGIGRGSNIDSGKVSTMLSYLKKCGISEFYQLYLPWMQAKKFHTVKFEDLIGPNGGGSQEAQLREIKKIADHLGIQISDDKVLSIAQDLFGGTKTFRKGEIGAWKKHFTPEIKKIFKKTLAGQLLIDLGYEKDFNW